MNSTGRSMELCGGSCVMCDYSLRGLCRDAMCPECGWPVVYSLKRVLPIHTYSFLITGIAVCTIGLVGTFIMLGFVSTLSGAGVDMHALVLRTGAESLILGGILILTKANGSLRSWSTACMILLPIRWCCLWIAALTAHGDWYDPWHLITIAVTALVIGISFRYLTKLIQHVSFVSDTYTDMFAVTTVTVYLGFWLSVLLHFQFGAILLFLLGSIAYLSIMIKSLIIAILARRYTARQMCFHCVPNDEAMRSQAASDAN